MSRTISNALTMTFDDGPEEPLAVGRQSGGDGLGAKLGILFGFKNSGRGTHSVKTRTGSMLTVASTVEDVTVIKRGSRAVARVDRGSTSTVFVADGAILYRIVADPAGGRTPDAFRLWIQNAGGVEVGKLDVILQSTGWALTFGGVLNVALNLDYFVNRTGAALPFPTLGTRLLMHAPPREGELEILLAVCVDLAIGLRVYVADMR